MNTPGNPQREKALSFGQAAERYDRNRPGYPAGALRWALEPISAGETVADIGAGTGLLTRALLGLGYDVIPVEPDPGMRARLDAATPGVTALDGSAERIPVADGALPAALSAQAYHWFDPDLAHPELGRAVRPGGVFAALWNIRDESVPWVREFSVVTGSGSDGTLNPNTGPAGYGPLFGEIERASFRHATTHTPDSLVELVRTRSYYLTDTPAGQAGIEQGIRRLAIEHPDLAGRDSFELPYVTYVYRARRR